MSEHPQFVGSSEAPKQNEFVLSPEQQRIVDALRERGYVVEKKVQEAREKAGNQLKQLRGKELVQASWKQFTTGLVEMGKLQAQYILKGSIVGGGFGMLMSLIDGFRPSILPKALGKGALLGAQFGGFLGWEGSWKPYNQQAANLNLPETKWYDWAVANIAGYGVATIRNPNKSPVVTGAKIMAAELVNPNTISATKNLIVGIWQMATPKR